MARTPIPPKVRWQVLARDGFRCRYCGAKGGDAVLVVDHSDPVSNGGGNDPDNLITSCEICNQGKGASRSTIIAELEYRIEALEKVFTWLEIAWCQESGQHWVPGEYTYLHLISNTENYAEAERILREVGARLRGGELRPDAECLDICNLIAMYAEFIDTCRGVAWAHGVEITPEELEDDRRRFWTDPEWHGGMLALER